MDQRDPSAQADVLADRLRALRKRTGMSGKEFAALNRWAASKVSRIESGQQRPSAHDIAAWTQACNVGAEATDELLALLEHIQRNHREWKRRLRRGQAQVQAGYVSLVQKSMVIRHFETAFVPGLLQTPEYARRVLTEMSDLHEVPTLDVDAAVAERMRRQQLLYDTTRTFEFLIAEPVLRWLVCPVETMRAQLDRLQTVIGLPNVRFGILPMGVKLTTTPQNSFQMYDNLVCVETFLGESRHTGEAAALYATVMERMWTEATTGDNARTLLTRAVADLDGAR